MTTPGVDLPDDSRTPIRELRSSRPDGPEQLPASQRGRFTRPLTPVGETLAAGAARRLPREGLVPMVVAALAFVVMTAVLAGVGLLLVDSPLGSGVRGWDDSFSREVTTGRTIDGEELSSFVSSSADAAPIVGAALVVTAALLVLRRWRDLFFLPLALLLENLVFLSVSQLVARDRPDVVRLGTTPPTHSFPSGHVAATVVVCFGIVVLLGADRWPRPWRFLAWVAAAVPVLAVGTSRVYGGLHFTTDVVVGVVVGSSALAVAAVASRASWLASRTEAAVSS